MILQVRSIRLLTINHDFFPPKWKCLHEEHLCQASRCSKLKEPRGGLNYIHCWKIYFKQKPSFNFIISAATTVRSAGVTIILAAESMTFILREPHVSRNRLHGQRLEGSATHWRPNTWIREHFISFVVFSKRRTYSSQGQCVFLL